VTADQQWIMYIARPWPVNGKPQPQRLMRVPLTGGTPELIFESHTLTGERCAHPPATLCIAIEGAANERIISLLDPMRGKGAELFRIPLTAAEADISPDGKHFAYVAPGGNTDTIRILGSAGKVEREFALQGWSGVNAIDWAAGGKGLFI